MKGPAHVLCHWSKVSRKQEAGQHLYLQIKEEGLNQERSPPPPGSIPYLLAVPASVDAHIAVPNGDPTQGTEEDSQLDVEDVCAATVKHTAFQEDFPTVLIPSGPIHDQVDFGFGPSPPDIPSEDGDHIRDSWCRSHRGGESASWLQNPHPAPHRLQPP